MYPLDRNRVGDDVEALNVTGIGVPVIPLSFMMGLWVFNCGMDVGASDAVCSDSGLTNV